MNRTKLVDILKGINGDYRGIMTSDALNVIRDYCLEHGKTMDQFKQLLLLFKYNNSLIYQCLNISLEYYEKKFHINKWYSKPDVLGQKQVLLIN